MPCQKVSPPLVHNQQLRAQMPGDHKVTSLGSPEDARQLLRTLAVLRPALPTWRTMRPALVLECAYVASEQGGTVTVAVQCALAVATQVSVAGTRYWPSARPRTAVAVHCASSAQQRARSTLSV